MTAQPTRVAYVVSRFPAASETFVVRELNALVCDGRFEVTLMSLFPSADDFVHPEAERWMARLQRPGATDVMRALAWCLVSRPTRLASVVTRLVAETWRSPRELTRSLATVGPAAAHALTVRKLGIEHVHAHFASYPALAAWACGRLTGVPYSFTAHAYDIFVSQRMLQTKIAEAAFVVTISRFNRRFLGAYGGNDESVSVVHCGIDPDLYRFRPRAVPDSGPIRMLCVASLQEKKGHRYLLEALASTPRLARVHLDLVGGGELREQLEDIAASLGIDGRVTFLGPRTEEEVRRLLEDADVFVLPSIVASDGQMEGLPVALIEALASGVPTVATNLSGIPELIQHEQIGILAEPGDVGSMADAIERLIDDSHVDAAAGRALVESEFDIHESARALARLFEASAERSPKL
jgi:glycosyltransferase involved in cell wall biosynthesis